MIRVLGLSIVVAVKSSLFLWIIHGIGLVFCSTPAYADWPVIWDGESRGDISITAQLGDGDDHLYVLAQTYVQSTASPRASLLRLRPSGSIEWLGIDSEMRNPASMALHPSGSTLVAGIGAGSAVSITSFSAVDGSVEWRRSLVDAVWGDQMFGTPAEPTWSESDAEWWMPVGKNGKFAVVGYDIAGTAIPEWSWAPPAGIGSATAVQARTGGGFFVAGTFHDGATPPGWWTVAVDGSGGELWRHFDDGDTGADLFSGAKFLATEDDSLIACAIDETACGVFSLRLWSLNPTDGTERWSRSWPPPGDCSSFVPHSVVASGDRIIATGGSTALSNTVLSFDNADGALLWQREFSGSTSVVNSAVSSRDGSALVATSLFPNPNPGPLPLWAAAWDRSGTACGEPQELLPARVTASVRGRGNRWLIVGYGFSSETLEDIVVQAVRSPCGLLFGDGFEG